MTDEQVLTICQTINHESTCIFFALIFIGIMIALSLFKKGN